MLDLSEPGKLETVPLPYSSFGSFDVRQEGGRLLLALTGASALKPSEVAVLQVADVDALLTNSAADWTVLRKSTNLEVPWRTPSSLLCTPWSGLDWCAVQMSSDTHDTDHRT